MAVSARIFVAVDVKEVRIEGAEPELAAYLRPETSGIPAPD